MRRKQLYAMILAGALAAGGVPVTQWRQILRQKKQEILELVRIHRNLRKKHSQQRRIKNRLRHLQSSRRKHQLSPILQKHRPSLHRKRRRKQRPRLRQRRRTKNRLKHRLRSRPTPELRSMKLMQMEMSHRNTITAFRRR